VPGFLFARTTAALPAAVVAGSLTYMKNILQDSFGRKVTYLRLSVTDRCDFRCTYCMAEKMSFMPRNEIMSLEECLLVARTFVGLGVDKIRLTGGEPLVRRDFVWLAARIRELPGLRELALTTNGSQLEELAVPLAQAGVDRINISLDSLVPETFRRITRTGELSGVLAGIAAALDAFGSRRVKLNTVLLRGVNHHELHDMLQFAQERGMDISFIEQMPLGDTGVQRTESYYSNDEVWAELSRVHELIASADSSGGPAKYWRIKGVESRIGFISPHTHNFCEDCNRMRVTARGELFPCLGGEGRVELLPALRAHDEAALRALIARSTSGKPKGHEFDLSEAGPAIVRFMSRTGG
jgi:GTP 3',8-cyclase